ncbi:hypothetical protein C4D60_Mb02t09590 [Musa balbisiana]|uniref:Uncharacterized protein n=1 Tax=Musa balbisiana TaxID=52838 RepID=A0A4S8I9G8_MUSBA|nr:hypothetical protein C4D60_Mb02t09590 [Musa balbisiana]
MASGAPISAELEQIDGEIQDIFRALQNWIRLRILSPNRQSKQLEELTGKMRECKQLIKEFDREIKDQESRNTPDVSKQLNEKKQTMIDQGAELICGHEKNPVTIISLASFRVAFVHAIKYQNSLGNQRVELFDMGAGGSDPAAENSLI